MFTSIPQSDAAFQRVLTRQTLAIMKKRAMPTTISTNMYYPSSRPSIPVQEYPYQFRLNANRYVDRWPGGNSRNNFDNPHRFRLYYIHEEREAFSLNGQGSSASHSAELGNTPSAGRNRRHETHQTCNRLRTLIAFWFLGLCNNYGYVVMLSVAYDILSDRFNSNEAQTVTVGTFNTTMLGNRTMNESRECNQLSTGPILIADILPSLLIKCISWVFPLAINFRMVFVFFLSVTGFILVASSKHFWVVILGVVLNAISSGLGEASILPYMAFFNDCQVITLWSSGAGAARFLGALSYLTLITFGFSMEQTLYILTIIPCIMITNFWFVMKRPTIDEPEPVVSFQIIGGQVQYNLNELKQEDNGDRLRNTTSDTVWEKVKYIPKLLPYMLPIGFVYFFEYFINQALYELVYFKENEFVPDHSQQYRLYHLTYQMSVFISRSSYNLLKIKNIKTFALVQGIIAILFLVGATYSVFPGFTSVMVMIAVEGMIGGAAYVNTFQKITSEVARDKREFALAISSLADAIGTTMAVIIAIPVHNYICALPVKNLSNEFFNFK